MDPMMFGEAARPAAAPMEDPFQGMPVVQPGGDMTKRIPEMTELRRWEDQHERELEDVAMKEEAKKKDRRKAAAEELQKWHDERLADLEKRRAAKRTEQDLAQQTKEQAAQRESSNVW